MDSRPATQASTGRHLLRSAIAEAVASDPAQRGVASTGAPGWRSRTPIWVGLGAVVALTAAVIIGTMLRTGTPGGVTSATSAPAAAATPSAQAPAMPPATAPSAAQAGARSPPPTEPPSAPGTRLRSARAAATGPPARATASTADCSSPHRPGDPSAARACRTRPAVPSRSLSPNACSPPKAGRPGPPAPTSSACADQSRSLPSRCQDRDAAPQIPRAPLIAEPRHLAVVLPEFGPSGSAQQDQRSCDERPGSLPAAVAAPVPEDAEPLLTSGEVARRLGVTPAGGRAVAAGGWWSAPADAGRRHPWGRPLPVPVR